MINLKKKSIFTKQSTKPVNSVRIYSINIVGNFLDVPSYCESCVFIELILGRKSNFTNILGPNYLFKQIFAQISSLTCHQGKTFINESYHLLHSCMIKNFFKLKLELTP